MEFGSICVSNFCMFYQVVKRTKKTVSLLSLPPPGLPTLLIVKRIKHDEQGVYIQFGPEIVRAVQ